VKSTVNNLSLESCSTSNENRTVPGMILSLNNQSMVEQAGQRIGPK